MLNEDWYQEPIKESYAKDLLKDNYVEGYKYFLVLSPEESVVHAVDPNDENSSFDITLVHSGMDDMLLEYDDEKEYIKAGGTVEELRSYKRKGSVLKVLIMPILFVLLTLVYIHLVGAI